MKMTLKVRILMVTWKYGKISIKVFKTTVYRKPKFKNIAASYKLTLSWVPRTGCRQTVPAQAAGEGPTLFFLFFFLFLSCHDIVFLIILNKYFKNNEPMDRPSALGSPWPGNCGKDRKQKGQHASGESHGSQARVKEDPFLRGTGRR